MSNIRWYKLEDRKPVQCTHGEFAKILWDDKSRSVGKTEVGQYFVSTLFLCMGSQLDEKGRPLLFETRIFDDAPLDYQQRYATWEEAEAGHAEAIKYAENLLALDESEVGQ